MYGAKGVIHADNRNDLRVRLSEGYDGFTETRLRLEERPAPYQDPFAFFAAVIRNEITVPSYDLSSLENNMMVMEILDAARLSAQSGRAVLLD